MVLAAWWTLHAFLAATLMRLALGDFADGDMALGVFEPVGMAQVMQHLLVPLTPLPAFAVMFVLMAGLAYAAALLWRHMAQALAATDVDAITANALGWAIRQQLLTAWLLVPLAATATVWWAVQSRHSWAVVALIVLFTYLAPLLVLRPRWLGGCKRDSYWLPSMAAVGIFVVSEMLYLSVAAGFSALGGIVGGVLSFVLAVWISWLVASALLFLRRRQDIRPHLVSRLTSRFAVLTLLGTLSPLAIGIVWLLPPLLLAFHYAIFIAPTVAHLAPHLPEAVTMAHRLFVAVADPVANYWWAAAVPLLSTAGNLYMGRCLVQFAQHAQEPIAYEVQPS